MKNLRIQSLDNGWFDMDHLLLHAAFQLLVDFMEKEDVKRIDWNADKSTKKAWAEAKSLYHWWTNIYPKRKSPLDDKKLGRFPIKYRCVKNMSAREIVWPDKKKYAKHYKAIETDIHLKKQWYLEDNKNLHRLINIRKYLWT